MDVDIEDGEGLTTDPVSLEMRLSPDFQKAFIALCTGTLKTLQSFKAATLYHLATDQGIRVKGRKHRHLMTVLTKYVGLICAVWRLQNIDSIICSGAIRGGLIMTRISSIP